VSDVEAGALYQEIGTGKLFSVLDLSETLVRLRQEDPPFNELDVPCETFLERYAIADSA